MKKTLSILLVLAATASLFTGCRSKQSMPPVGPAVIKAECKSCAYFNDFSTTVWYSSPTTLRGKTWTIRNAEEWTSFTAEVSDSSYVFTAPIDFTDRMLIATIVGVDLDAQLLEGNVCTGPDKIRVDYILNHQCPGLGDILYTNDRLLMYAIPASNLPAVWEGKDLPYTGPPCPTPTPIVWFPYDPPIIVY